MLEMSLLLEECGYAALPGPFLFSSALAVSALVAGGCDALNRRWLEPLAEGHAIGTVAVMEPQRQHQPGRLDHDRASQSPGWLLSGTKTFVPYTQVADFMTVLARTGSGAHDTGFFLVEPKQPGVKIRRLNNLNLTRRVSEVGFNSVEIPSEAALARADLGT
jgi:alkylation response protein AidB-like acyl-CoA dehydrogenase